MSRRARLTLEPPVVEATEPPPKVTPEQLIAEPEERKKLPDSTPLPERPPRCVGNSNTLKKGVVLMALGTLSALLLKKKLF